MDLFYSDPRDKKQQWHERSGFQQRRLITHVGKMLGPINVNSAFFPWYNWSGRILAAVGRETEAAQGFKDDMKFAVYRTWWGKRRCSCDWSVEKDPGVLKESWWNSWNEECNIWMGTQNVRESKGPVDEKCFKHEQSLAAHLIGEVQKILQLISAWASCTTWETAR